MLDGIFLSYFCYSSTLTLKFEINVFFMVAGFRFVIIMFGAQVDIKNQPVFTGSTKLNCFM